MLKKTTITIGLLLILVTGIFAQTDDPLNDYIFNLPMEELNDHELHSLKQMREEEKLARDVYLALYEKWNVNLFNNIAKSEQTHTDMVALIVEKYGLDDPFIDELGVFADSVLQELYFTLVEIGNESLAQAVFVGCTIEDLDIYDLKEFLVDTDNQDIRMVYQNLLKGSRNHARSFNGQYAVQGETYVTQFITAAEWEQIISSPSEQGAVDADGNPFTFTSVKDVGSVIELPRKFIAAQNYPNPFNPQTTIQFDLPNAANVSVKIYDVRGKLVKTLANDQGLSAGSHSVIWNGTDSSENLVSSGIYLYRFENGAEIITNQMMLIK
jgi:hypothetical protein